MRKRGNENEEKNVLNLWLVKKNKKTKTKCKYKNEKSLNSSHLYLNAVWKAVKINRFWSDIAKDS